MPRSMFVKIVILYLTWVCTISARAPDPSFSDSIENTADGQSLIKIGEYRYVYRMFFKLYDVALYSTQGATLDAILKANIPLKLQFRYLHDINKSIVLKSSEKILENNLSSNELELIAKRLDRLNTAYRTVKKGDRSSLSYHPETGTTLIINGAPVITIEGKDFAQLYFKIWLGERPISYSLKDGLLSGQ